MKISEPITNASKDAEWVSLPKYHRKRRLTQVAMLLLIVLIPLTGLLRVDLQAGNFVILGRQIWWSDYSLMLGFWTMLATAAAMTYSTIGTVWCGWACPQNSLSELINLLTARLLGKRAGIHIDSGKTQVAAAKNKVVNWLVLGLAVLAISCVLAIIPFLYLYPADAVWAMVTFGTDARLPRFTHYLYFVVVFAIFLDIAMIRNVLCSYFCLYRIWQHIFKTRQTLHVEYRAERAAECARCNYCKASCFLGFNPTEFKIYDSCINCGECIDACNKLHAPQGEHGLLQFEFGERRKLNTWRDNVDRLASRLGWAGAIFLIGVGLLVWGMLDYSPYNLVVYRAERAATAGDYRIMISNKLYAPAQIALSVKGIPADSYRLETQNLELAPASHRDVDLQVKPGLSKGLHRIVIEARAADGRVERFGVEHYAEGNDGTSHVPSSQAKTPLR